MASSYTPRTELARMLRDQRLGVTSRSTLPPISSLLGGPAPSRSAVQLGRTAADMTVRYPQLKDLVSSTKAGTAQPKPGGVLGTILNNPVSRIALKPLEALAIPGRAVIAGIEEIRDFADTDPSTSASFGDFVKNVKDPTYGFGKAFKIDTGSIWLDRAIGLAGDIFLDPVTYVTFGAGKFASAAGRIDLAGIILRNTGDNALAARVAQFGRAAPGLTNEMLINAGANRHGLYFLGKRTGVGTMRQGLKIPGTGALGAAGERSLHRLRLAASRSKAGTMLQKVTMPKDALNARRALLRGELSDRAAGPVIAFLSGEPLQRRVVGETLQAEEAKVLSLLDNEKSMGLDMYDDKVFEYIENPELLAGASPEVQRAVTEVWGKLLDDYEQDIISRMRELDPNITVEQLRQEGYWPRMVSDRGVEYLQNSNEPFAIRLREIRARDPLANSTNFKMRTMEEGDEFFGTILTTDDLKSTKRLNEIANTGGFVGDFFETRVSVVFPKYIRSYADEVGLLARHKALVDGGFWQKVDDIGFMENSVDAELLKVVKRQAQASMTSLYQARRSLVDAFGALQKAMADVVARGADDTALAGRLATLETLEGTVRSIDTVLAGGLMQTEESMTLAAQALGKMKKSLADLYGAKIVNGKIVFQGADNLDLNLVINGIVDEATALEKQIDEARAALTAIRENGELTEDVMKQLEGELSKNISKLTTQIDQRTKSIRDVMEVGNQLESAITKIINGETVEGLNDVVNNALRILDINGGQGDVDALLRAANNVQGTMADEVVKDATQAGSMFEKVTELSTVNRGSIQKTTADIEGMMSSLFAGSLTLDSTRELALAMIYRDRFLFGANMPASVRAIHDRLEGLLLKADAASSMAAANRKAAKGGGQGVVSAKRGYEAEWEFAYDAVRAIQSDLETFTALRAAMQGMDIATMSPQTIPWETILANKRLMDEHPVLSVFAPRELLDPSVSRVDYDISINAGRLEAEDIVGRPNLSPDADMLGRSGAGATARTWGELNSMLDDAIKFTDSKLDDPDFFTSNRGVSSVKYTGRQVAAQMEEYYGLLERRRVLLQKREAMRQRMAGQLGDFSSQVYELDARIAELKELAAQYEAAGDTIRLNRVNRKMRSAETRRNKAVASGERLYGDQGDVIRNVRLTAKEEAELTMINDAIKKMTGGGYQMIEQAGAIAKTVQKELADEVAQYYAVSEVIKRFNGVASVLEPYGFTPTERAFSSIVQSVVNRIMPTIDRRLERAKTLDIVFSQLDEKVAFDLQMAMRGSDEFTPHQIFMDAVNSLPESSKQALMEIEPIFGIGARTENGVTRIVGADPQVIKRRLMMFDNAREGKGVVATGPDGKPKLNKNGQPIYLRDTEAMAARRAFFEREVRPWFEETFPESQYNMTNAQKALNSAAGSASATTKKAKAGKMTPFNPDATPEVIADWFAARLGDTKINARRSRVVGARNVAQDRVKELRRSREKIARLLVPDVDPADFVNSPFEIKTPWLYGEIIKDRIDVIIRLEAEKATAVATRQGKKARVTAQAKKARDAERAAARLGKPQTFADRPDAITKPIDDAFKRTEAWGRANADYREAEAALDDLRTQIDELTAKQRRVKGLNKTETKKLESLRKKRDAALIKFNSAKGVLARTAEPTADDAALVAVGRRPDKYVRRYQELISSPLYAKAQRDAMATETLTKLAPYDLSAFTKGFFNADGSPVVLPDGTPVVFTREEWVALFAPPFDAVQQKKLVSTVARLNREITALRKEREGVAAILSQSQDAIASGTLTPAVRRKTVTRANEATSRISIIDSVIAQLSEERNLTAARAAYYGGDEIATAGALPQTLARQRGGAIPRAVRRELALTKLMVLVHGVDGNGGILYGSLLDDFISGKHHMFNYSQPGQRGALGAVVEPDAGAVVAAAGAAMATAEEAGKRIAVLQDQVRKWDAMIEKFIQGTTDNPDMVTIPVRYKTRMPNGQIEERVQEYTLNDLVAAREKALARIKDIRSNPSPPAPRPTAEASSVWRVADPDNPAGPRGIQLAADVTDEDYVARAVNVENQWKASPEYAHLQKVAEAEQGTIVKKYLEAMQDAEAQAAKLELYQQEYDRLVTDGKIPELDIRIRRETQETRQEVALAAEMFKARQGRAVQRMADDQAQAIEGTRKELAELKGKRATQLKRLTPDAKKSDAANAARQIRDYDIKIAAVEKRLAGLESSGIPMVPSGRMTREQMMQFARGLQEQSLPQGGFFRTVSPETAERLSAKDRDLIARIDRLWREHDNIFRGDPEQLGELAIDESVEITKRIEGLMKQLSPVERQRAERSRMMWERARMREEVAVVREDLAQLPAAREARKVSLEAEIKAKQERLTNVNALVRALQEGREDTLAELAATLGFWESAQFATGRMTADELFEFSRRAINEGQGTIDAMRNSVELVRGIVEDSPVQQVKEALKRGKGKKLTDAQLDEAIRLYRQWYSEHTETLRQLELNPDDPVARAWAAVGLAEQEFITASMDRGSDILSLVYAEMPIWKERVIKPFQEGWEAAARANGLMESTDRRFSVRVGAAKANLIGNAEAIDLLQNIARINNPGTVDDLARVMRGYTGFFRAYATLSPGFHVRNSISNIMSMFTAGADPRNMVEGFRLWKSFDAAMGYNKTLDEWVSTLAPELRDKARAAGQIMLGLSHGKTDDALQGFVQQNAKALGEQGSKIRDNAAIRLSRRAGHKADTAARFMLAWDSMVKGMEPDTAFNRTRRYLIDYQSRTMLDDVMRDVVPFWMWVSRNLPLQVVNRWTNPKAYLVYNRFVQNFSQSEEDSDTTMPGWLRDMGAVNLGGGLVFNPELPFSRTDAEIRGLTDPAKLMGYLNPGLRVPIELATGKNFFTGQQTSDEFVPVTGVMSGVLPLLQALGQTQPGPNGTVLAKRSALDALTGLVPPLSRVDRFFPSTDRGEGYLSGQVGGFFGVPFRQVTEGQQEAERFRRLEALRRLAERQRRMEG